MTVLTLGATRSLDVLKEAYEREWRAEKKRLKEERQQMLDEITLENKTLKAENRDLARQVANEQRRADRAEYSQIVQEREIMEWEAENQKKAEAWQQKQAQKNAIAVEVDEDARACYFKQAYNGKMMRMALILKLLGLDDDTEFAAAPHAAHQNEAPQNAVPGECTNSRCICTTEQGLPHLVRPSALHPHEMCCIYCDTPINQP